MSIPQSLLCIALLIAVSAFFSIAEMALAASRSVRLRQMADAGDARALRVLRMQQQPGRYFTVVQIGVNAVAILGGIAGEGALTPWLHTLLAPWMSEAAMHTLALALSVVLITSAFVVFADLAPKRLGMAEPERVALAVIAPMEKLLFAFAPLVWLYTRSTDWAMRALGLPMQRDERITTDDILAMAEEGTRAGVIDRPEQQVIENVFELDTRGVTSAMTPRDRIAWLRSDASEEEIRLHIAATPYSSYPVCDEELDRVLGYADAKEMLQSVLRQQPLRLGEGSALLHRLLVVPDTLSLSEVLQTFRQKGEDFALIVNEYGTVVGLITLGDVMSTVMGGLVTPDDEELIVRRDDGSWLIDGHTPMQDVRRALALEEPPGQEDYDTLAGFLMVMLRRVPRRTDCVHWGGHRFEVLDVDNFRADQVLVTPVAGSGADAADASEKTDTPL